ncbi:rho GTPase-activating protein 23 isoform X2 [Prorops nasuta]|uniref:rho GTPase-activating protein 23 isoform X2 n=1 Tax=Prorops nasuta TaxID=863751 RepID=UPI0034CE6880
MADERKSPAVKHATPPPPASTGIGQGVTKGISKGQRETSPPRGPRTLLLRRSENGFGFTLRHFIVYPPESCCMLPGHERTKIEEPMDTIFVKQVRENSPAAEAGLRTGDRVVSVDGTPTRGEQYASVVQRIQQAGAWLRLLVVSKEDDILQRYFGETAHNPETNQRPRLRSPERISQKQRRSLSMIPGPSPRARQSWVCTTTIPNTENQSNSGYQRQDSSCYKEQLSSCKVSSLNSLRRPLQDAARNQDAMYDRMDVRKREGITPAPQPYRTSVDSRFDLYDRTRPESIYSRPSSEQLYDRIKDPIYERVRPGEPFDKEQLRYPVSRAEPQVPIYRPGRRVVTRRASEGSGGTSQDSDNQSLISIDVIARSSDPGSRLSMDSRSLDSRRDSSPASKDSISSFDSNSTLTGNECSDDSVIMTRLRKSFEQKEEFLRRPSHPIGLYMTPEALTPLQANSVIQREFYARPQKLQRQVWPPGEQQQSTSRNSSLERSKPVSAKPTNQNVQRVKTDTESESDYSTRSLDENQSSREKFYSSLYDANQKDCCGSSKDQQRSSSSTARSNSSNKAFVTTLTRIHENVSSGQAQDLRNGTSSLPSSPGPDKKGNDKFPVPPQGLQIVSKRAKQFESGRLLSDDDEPTSDRTNLYKSELSRLSNKRSVPNVAVRKREFESKAESQEPRRIPANRESKSLDAELPSTEVEPVRLRARSNSAESWEAVNGISRRSARQTWQTEQEEDSEDKQSSNEDNNKPKRQDNYLQAVRTQLDYESPPVRAERMKDSNVLVPEEFIEMISAQEIREVPKVTVSPPTPIRPNQLSIPNPIRPLDSPDNHHPMKDDSSLVIDAIAPASGVANNGVVLRRQKNTQLNDEDRATRRVSYLKATWGERMHVDSDLDLSDTEPAHSVRSSHRRWRPPLFPSDITPLRRIFEDMTQVASLHRHSHRNSIGSSHSSTCGTPKDVEPVEREGTLHVKFTVLDGKRSTDRSWKQVWGVLRGPILLLYKDRHSQSPSSTSESENSGQSVDVRCSQVDVAEDYTKRKHVLRVANPTAEVLLQTEDAASMALWLRALHKHAAADKPSDATTSKQQAVPQTPTTPNSNSSGNNQRLSPLPSHKGIKKLTSFRNRSPTGQSPVNKTRKPSTTIEPLQSPKTKTWKGRVAKQFRRMQVGSPSSPTAQLPVEGATFKVPLELCPPSSFSEFVPLIVEMCTSIVEARGLEVVGIYRVPGNTAAISQLTESVNKGFENINLQDPRWSDVNVISSLLKSFFRQLPDSLLTADLYPMFIDADKIEDPQRRMATIRKLLRDLPEHHFETLKFLMLHLKRIVDHSEVNKMEAKNLAIVFGPTLVRASGSRDNMVTMVTDMSHQCRIVESLLNNVDWFFSEEDLDDLSRLSVNLSLPAEGEIEPTSATNHSLLLNNIQKVEGMREMVSARDIVSSIISAANRKMQRRRKGQDETDNDDHEYEKNKSKQESEAVPAIRQSMALNERQCSVSEIVLMHENKNQNQDRSLNNANKNNNNSPSSNNSNRGKYLSQQQNSSSDSSRLSSDTGLSCLDSISNLSSASIETKQSNDDVAIRTYAGLSATTQERIRRFEQETKAMLQRDQHRQRREAERREEERRRIEMEWQMAKNDMENDDILDNVMDNAATPYLNDRISSMNDRLTDKSLTDFNERHARSRSTTRITPLSIAVQQQPTARLKAQASNQISNIIGEKMNNGVIKKFKTDKESSTESLQPVRYGSLDSLHEVHTSSNSSNSPSQQHRGVPIDISDDAGSCFLHWTQKILTINKKLSRHTASPGFWCYISSHLHGAGWGASSATSKTPAPSPPPPPPPPPTQSSRDTGPPDNPTNPATTATPGIGAGASSKTLNKFLRGSDLLTSLTTTFDRKWRSLLNPSGQLTATTAENTAGSKNLPDQTDKNENTNANGSNNRNSITDAVYRDPSLHRSPVDKNYLRPKNDVPEKDTDSSVLETSSETNRTPDNDRNAIVRKKTDSSSILNSSVETGSLLDATEKDEKQKTDVVDPGAKPSEDESSNDTGDVKVNNEKDMSYTNKLEKFESLARSETRSRLKRSESLNKRSENTTSKLKRSESLNKHSDRLASPTNGKLKRSESLNKHSDRSESPNSKLKRSESLTKTEKTECNISKRRQSVRKESTTKLKRKNGMPERSIKRRHTVGGTKDFDKVHWWDNKLQSEAERVIRNDSKPKKSQLRTSSPDLSSNRVNVADTSFLIEVSFRGPSKVVFNVTNARPQSLPDANLASKVFKVPLESHV